MADEVEESAKCEVTADNEEIDDVIEDSKGDDRQTPSPKRLTPGTIKEENSGSSFVESHSENGHQGKPDEELEETQTNAEDEDTRPKEVYYQQPQEEELLKPFERGTIDDGWTREVVARSVIEDDRTPQSRRALDVYYYSPHGDKLRSIPEVETYLSETRDGSELTSKCFTFTRSLIHKPPFETCRAAKRRQIQTPAQKKVEEEPEPAVAKFPRRGKRKIKAPRKLADEEDPPPRKRSVAKPQIQQKKEVKVTEEKLAGRCSLNCSGQEGIYPSVHCQHCLCLFHPHCIGLKKNDKAKFAAFVCPECTSKDCSEKPENTDIPPTVNMRKSKERARKVIQFITEKKTRVRMPGRKDFGKGRGGRYCGRSRKILARPADEITSLPHATEDENATQTQSSISILKTLPPLRKAPDLKSSNASAEIESKKHASSGSMSTRPPALKASPGAQLLPKRVPVEACSTLGPNMDYLIVANPDQSQTPVPTAICSNVAFSQVMQMGSLIPSIGTSMNGVLIRMPTPTTPNPNISSSIAPITGAPASSSSPVQLLVEHVPGVIYPTTTASHVSLTPVSSNALKTVKRKPLIRRPFPPLHHYEGSKKTNVAATLQSVVPAALAKVTRNGEANSEIRRQGMSTLRRFRTKGSYVDGGRKLARVISLRKWNGPVPTLCHINHLHAGLDAMLKIFGYLNAGDLVRASRVCRTWHTTSSFPCLWKTLSLRDTRIGDWEGFAKVVRNFNSTRLDLRGMQHFEDRNRTWHGFSSILDDLQQVKRVDFGEVPSSLIHTVANILQNLEVLIAEEITDGNNDNESRLSGPCGLDIGKLGQMRNLRKLRIKGLNGIRLPTFCSAGGIMNLEALTNLTHLALTSLKDVADSEFGFLSSLTNLTTLELGDCNGWRQETFAKIGHLENLQRLRLEMKSSSNLDDDFSLDAALRSLHRLVQLELVLFPIPSWFCVTLETLKSLKELVFWTDTENEGAARNNSNIVKAVETARSLKQLTWGIVLPKSQFEKPSTMELDQFSKCIPFDKETTFPSICADALSDVSATGQRLVCPNALMGLMRNVLPMTEVRVVVSPLVTAFPACSKFR